MQRPIIEIDEQKCDGCGQCVLNCAEGALAIIDGKAKLVSESFCDGLGACLHCPQSALSIITREAPAFDEKAAFAARQQNDDVFLDRTKHRCPGTALRHVERDRGCSGRSPCSSWPIQLRLLPPAAPFLKEAHVLLAAHCTGFSCPDLFKSCLPGHALIIACPKLEPKAELSNKLIEILKAAQPSKIDILRMSVPCCGGLEQLVNDAISKCGVNIPVMVQTAAIP